MLNFILWMAVYICLQLQFGMIWGLLMGLALQFAVAVFVTYQNAGKEAETKAAIRADNVLITIVAEKCQDQLVYLAYNVPNNKFLLQSLNIDEFAEQLVKKFEGKNIYVSKGKEQIELLATAIKEYK